MESIFTKIINGDLPGCFVWDDEQCVAIMTIQPIKEGHVLVIPKQEINHWDDLSDELAAHLMIVAKKIARALKQTYTSERVGLIIAGLEVPHTHLHVLPIDTLSDFDFSAADFSDPSDLAKVAEKIKQAL